MAYLDQLIQLNAYQDALAGRIQGAYAAYYAPYEVQTPQTPVPNPYTLATQGYRQNALIYAAINYRARCVAEAPIEVKTISTDGDEERIDHHALKELILNPNSAMTEEQFWQVAEINLCVAGFSAWEIEFSNGGRPLALWPMRSDWCQFYRGVGQPIRAIRYQPYGLPPVDVPIENVVLFQYYDPIYPLLKGLSPLAVALNVVQVDNFATAFLNDFMQHGAMPQGLLTSDQMLQPQEAEDISKRWIEKHGGAQNWSKPAVLGRGTTYQATGAAFSPGFDFTKIDGRDEARMCMAIGVEPILIGAQVGLQASTYSNYKEAREAFYEARIQPEWRYLASELREQLMPHFESAPSAFTVSFDLNDIKALQENKTEAWQRSIQAWQANLIDRDTALQEMKLDPVDDGAVVYYKDTLSFAPPDLGAAVDNSTPESIVEPAGDTLDAQQAAQELERKQFKAFIRHGRKAADFSFKHLSASEIAGLTGAQPSETGAPFRLESHANGLAYP